MQIHALAFGGDVTVIAPGDTFVTRQILIQTDEDAAHFDAEIGDVIDRDFPHSPAALTAWTPDDLARYCVQLVEVDDPPTGKREASRAYAVSRRGVISATSAFEDIPAPPVPQEVTRVQGRIALKRAGKFAAAESAATNAGGEPEEYWLSTDRFRRDNETLIALWHGIGGTDAELDALFREAATVAL
jgi:hypothetical protein